MRTADYHGEGLWQAGGGHVSEANRHQGGLRGTTGGKPPRDGTDQKVNWGPGTT
jgi:hypothetical protein